MAVLSSLDPSSQSRNSKSCAVCAMTLAMASSMNFSAFMKIMITETRGTAGATVTPFCRARSGTVKTTLHCFCVGRSRAHVADRERKAERQQSVRSVPAVAAQRELQNSGLVNQVLRDGADPNPKHVLTHVEHRGNDELD